MSMRRVESSWCQPHKTSIHLERRSLESAPSGLLPHLLAGELSSQTGCANNHGWLQVVQSSQHGLQLISITIHNLQGDLPRQLGIDLSLDIKYNTIHINHHEMCLPNILQNSLRGNILIIFGSIKQRRTTLETSGVMPVITKLRTLQGFFEQCWGFQHLVSM